MPVRIDGVLALLGSALAAGCAFDTSNSTTGGENPGAFDGALGNVVDADTQRPDAVPARTDATPGTPDAADVSTPICDAQLSELVLCMQFEEMDGATTLVDESQYGNSATVANATFPAGQHDKGLQGSGKFNSLIAKSDSLDTDSQLSIELWLRPDEAIDEGRWGLFDNNNQYGFFLVDGNRLRCTATGGPNITTSGSVVTEQQWQHVACTYDGSTMNIFVDGTEVATTSGSGAISTNGSDGSALAQNSPDGDELIGRMDTLRVWSVARTRQELCAGAGLTCL